MFVCQHIHHFNISLCKWSSLQTFPVMLDQLLKKNAQMYKCSNAQILKCSNAQILKCSNAKILKRSNTQMLKCSNAKILKRSNAQMLKYSIAQILDGATRMLRPPSSTESSLHCFWLKRCVNWIWGFLLLAATYSQYLANPLLNQCWWTAGCSSKYFSKKKRATYRFIVQPTFGGRGGRCSFFLTMRCFNDAMIWNS